MKIYIVSRFSLITSSLKDWSNEPEGAREKWLHERLHLFRTFLLPSLKCQTRVPDKVLLLMDPSDQPFFEQEIGTQDGLIEPLFCPAKGQKKAIMQYCESDLGGPVIFARVDTDDMISDNYTEALLKTFSQDPPSPSPAYAIVPHGWVSDMRIIQRIEHKSPPFVAVFYQTFDGVLDWGGNHTKIHQLNPLKCRSASWIITVHGGNVANGFYLRRSHRVTESNWPHQFPVPDNFEKMTSLTEMSPREIVAYTPALLLVVPGFSPIRRILRQFVMFLKMETRPE